jgi:HK97 family phage major capsid protein/HK97 family phage prohead protease
LKPEDLAAVPPARLPFPVTRAVADAIELSSEDDGKMPTMVGHFSTFGDWYEVDSWIEGRFMERIAPTAFDRTIAENRSQMKVLYDHGQDPQIGNKILGTIEDLRVDEIGPAYVVPLFDTSYNRDLRPGLEAGVYGSSFRFNVEQDEWTHSPARTSHNPEGIPERTITEARTHEFGPVTFPANPKATAGVRSTTDAFYRRAKDPEQFEDLLRAAQVARTPSTPPVAAPPAQENPKVEPTIEYTTRDEKASRVRELKENLAAQAVAFPGVLPVEEQARWYADNKELTLHEADIAAWDARQAKLAAFIAKPPQTEPGAGAAPMQINAKSESDIFDTVALERSSRSIEERNQKYRDNALRAAEQIRVNDKRYDQDKSRERLASLIEFNDSDDKEIAHRVLNTGSPQYRAAFDRYVRSGGEERGTALAVGVDATGGFAVPVQFDPTMIAIGAWTAINPIRATCRVVTISGTDTWQALTATAVPAVYAAEAAAATEQGPTFARPEFIAKRAHSFVTASYEMAQDRPDLVSELSVLFGEGKDTNEEAQFTIGVGTTVFPQGIGLKDAYTRVDTVTNDVFAVADVRAMEAALPIRHRFGAQWYLSRAAIRAIQAFETTGGQLFNGVNYAAVGNPQTALSGNTGLTLLGYPVNESPSMPFTPTTDDTTWGVLMNPSSYVIVDRVGMSVKVIPDMLNGATPSFPTGEIGIYAFWRNTARVLNADGGRQGGIL